VEAASLRGIAKGFSCGGVDAIFGFLAVRNVGEALPGVARSVFSGFGSVRLNDRQLNDRQLNDRQQIQPMPQAA